MLRKIGGARNLALWRAWCDMEPRGEARGDMQAALVASAHCGEPIADLAELLRGNWEHETPATKQRRKSVKELRESRKARENAEKIKQRMEGAKRGQRGK